MNASESEERMNDLSEVIAKDLADYYAMVRDQTHHWVDALTEEQIWRQPFAHGNTVGHLLLHMTGNLNYYIGARVANTDYVRDRDREFTEPEPRPKAEILAAFDRVIALVIETIFAPSRWTPSFISSRWPNSTGTLASASHWR